MSHDMLLQHPFNPVVNLGEKSKTDKNWTKKYHSIRNSQITVRTGFQDGGLFADWSPLLSEGADDGIRRRKLTHQPNATTWVLGNEDEGADWFKNEIMSPVMSKFVDCPQLHHRGKYERGGVIVDSTFFWGKRRIAIGEYKRNLIALQRWMKRSVDDKQDQVKLGRELRG